MVDKVFADAKPEKRLFISLITRDISLIDAFLDLIDNSINAALEPLAAHLKTADDYQRLLANTKIKPKVRIEVSVGSGRIVVRDNAPGISADTAAKYVFRFGRDDDKSHMNDRLSVYGIGLKRALFKCGNKFSITSDHRDGGFELTEDVAEWSKDKKEPWHFYITPRPPATENFGTQITLSELHGDVLRRMDDGLFVSQLRERVSRTYAFFIGRIVDISLNGLEIDKESFEVRNNYAKEKFITGDVSCNITAGMASAAGEFFRDRNAGWFVFCNGRAILFADKTVLTGWAGGGLPIFQPKHRPFLGTVFFVSPDPEHLPWTTTKASINEESAVWQEAKRHMVKVGRIITGFLDGRYTEEGTGIATAELQDVSGRAVSVLTAAVSNVREFKPPTKPPPKTMSIQYNALISDVKKIATYLRRPTMSAREVGRHAFDHFLKNEVGEE